MSKEYGEDQWRDIYELAEAALTVPKEQRPAFLRARNIDAGMTRDVLQLAESFESPHDSTTREGSSIGRFELLQYLGAGGTGEVYAAHDSELRRTVAIKILKPEITSLENTAGRFLREARTASALNHPNIVTIYEIVRTESMLAIVMEFVKGKSLRELSGEPLSVETVRDVGTQMAAALAVAHEAGIVHRDIKPENIMRTADGRIKILDFGLAKQFSPDAETTSYTLQTGIPPGTLRYMAPEHYHGKEVTGKSDIFALGLILYELCTGRHPFLKDSPLDSLHAIATEQAIPPSQLNSAIPAQLESIVLSMLAKEPAERPSAAAIFEALPSNQEIENTALQTSNTPAHTIAVLPFANLGEDPRDSHLGDGLTEEVINVLAQIKGLKVIARTSSFAFKGRNEDIRRIARELGVNYVLEGSLQRHGKRIRITAQLIRAIDGMHVSSKRYERDMEDVFAIQDDVSADIATQLRHELKVAKTPPSSKALQGILTARAAWHRLNREDAKLALDALHTAIERHPDFSGVYAALASYHVGMTFEHAAGTREELSKATQAAQRAIELDDSDADAYGALADVTAMLQYDWAAAERYFLRASDLKPSTETRFGYVLRLLLPMARIEQALRECEEMILKDPLRAICQTTKAWALFLQRDYQAAAEACERALRLDPSVPRTLLLLSNIRAFDGAAEEALQLANRVLAVRGATPAVLLAAGTAQLKAGDLAAAGQTAEKLEAQSDAQGVNAGALAMFWALFGEKGRAVSQLHMAIDARDPAILCVRTLPWMDAIRAEPEYSTALRRMGFE